MTGRSNKDAIGGSEEKSPPLDTRVERPQIALGGLFIKRVCTKPKRETLKS